MRGGQIRNPISKSEIESGGVGFLFADPALDTDLAIDGLGLGEAVIDIFAEGVERDAALALPFAAGDVGAAEAAGALDADALGAEGHGHFDRLLHGTTEGDAAFELEGDVLGHELGLDLGFLDLLDVEEDFLAGELGELRLDVVDLLALATDDDAGTRGVDLDADAVGGALDENAGDAGLLELLHQRLTDDLVLKEEGGKIFFAGKPARLPVAADGKTETDRICFLAHGENQLVWPSERTMRMWDIFLRRGMAEPRAPALKRLRTGPVSTTALLTVSRSAGTLTFWSFSELAMALLRVLAMRRADLRGIRFK